MPTNPTQTPTSARTFNESVTSRARARDQPIISDEPVASRTRARIRNAARPYPARSSDPVALRTRAQISIAGRPSTINSTTQNRQQNEGRARENENISNTVERDIFELLALVRRILSLSSASIHNNEEISDSLSFNFVQSPRSLVRSFTTSQNVSLYNLPIPSVPIQNAEETSDLSSLNKCAICLETYVMNCPMATTCGHIYCRSCILRWLYTSTECPKCKESINTSRLLRIYP